MPATQTGSPADVHGWGYIAISRAVPHSISSGPHFSKRRTRFAESPTWKAVKGILSMATAAVIRHNVASEMSGLFISITDADHPIDDLFGAEGLGLKKGDLAKQLVNQPKGTPGGDTREDR